MLEEIVDPLSGQFLYEMEEYLSRREDVNSLRFLVVAVGVGADDACCGSPYMGVSTSFMRH